MAMTFMSNSARRRRALPTPSKIPLSCDPFPAAGSEGGRLALREIVRLLARQAAKEIETLPVVETP